jgi:hypothetical protein
LVRNERLTRYKKEWGRVMSQARIARVVESAHATKLRVEILSAPKPPKVVLPRVSKSGVSKLTDKIANEICEQLQRGASLALVASWVGITAHALSDWLERKGEPYATFQEAVSASLAYAEMNMINAITIGSYADANIALKWMAMRYPEKYTVNPQAPPGTSVTFDLGGFLQEVLKEREGADRVKALRAARQAEKIIEGETLPALPEATEQKAQP